MNDIHSRTTQLFRDMVAQSHLAMVASDMRAPDRPLVFVNDAFVAMTGYGRDEALGRNCRFLQGPDTDDDTVAAIRETIANGRDGYFEILNYRRDGTPFWNGLHIGPVLGADGEIELFFGAQRDATPEVELRESEASRARELAHRMGNLLAIVGMMVRSSARGEGEDALRAALEGRLQALSRSNALVSPAPEGTRTDLLGPSVPLRTVMSTVLNPVAAPGRLSIEGPDVALVPKEITNVALVVHELATNALKHGALSHEGGHVSVAWREDGGRVLLDWREEGGPPVATPTRRGMGSRLLQAVVRSSHRPDAAIDYHADGLRFRFDAANG